MRAPPSCTCQSRTLPRRMAGQPLPLRTLVQHGNAPATAGPQTLSFFESGPPHRRGGHQADLGAWPCHRHGGRADLVGLASVLLSPDQSSLSDVTPSRLARPEQAVVRKRCPPQPLKRFRGDLPTGVPQPVRKTTQRAALVVRKCSRGCGPTPKNTARQFPARGRMKES